jgi:site-specific DNA-methyltransferase (adenine-specific)
MVDRVSLAERRFRKSTAPELDVSDDVRMLYHDNTLRQLTYLRSELQSTPMTKWSNFDLMLAGAIAGILHGGHRSDGTSAFLSISMPNTFSMSPDYVRKYIQENGLRKIDQDVFDVLRDKLARIYMDAIPGQKGRTLNEDACQMLSGNSIERESVDLLLTSPPYLRVVNYGTSNWIRLWWLGVDDVSRESGAGRQTLDSLLDHRHTLPSYRDFMSRVFTGVRRVLSRDGVAIVVIGDVTTPSGSSYDLANQIWSEVGSKTDLKLVDLVEDSLPAQSKVSRIWGDTKGQATDRDCILVLSRNNGEFSTNLPEVDWDEPYKDGGPDAAHERARRLRTSARAALAS